MSDVGRQGQHVSIDIDSLSMPVLDTSAHECVSKILQAESSMPTTGSAAKCLAHDPKGIMHVLSSQRTAVVEHKELRSLSTSFVSIASAGIAAQRQSGTWMKRDQSLFTELPGADMQAPQVEVDIGALKPNSLGDPKAAGRHQADNGGTRLSPKPAVGRQPASRLHQEAQLRAIVDMRSQPPVSGTEQSQRWNLALIVPGPTEARERSEELNTASSGESSSATSGVGPAAGALDRECTSVIRRVG